MQRFGDFRPTQFDTRGLGSDGREDWLVVPVGRTRDSGVLDASNFETAWSIVSDAAVMDNEESADSLRFGHWGPGWFEIIVVRPDSHAHKAAEEIEASLADYPVLDDDDYSERENEYAQESWANMSVRDRVRLIQERGPGVSIFAARHDYIPTNDCGTIYDYCRSEN